MWCPNCACPTAVRKNKPIFGNSKKHKDKGKAGFESRIYCRICGWLCGE